MSKKRIIPIALIAVLLVTAIILSIPFITRRASIIGDET